MVQASEVVRVGVWGARHIHTRDHLAAVEDHPRAVLADVHSDIDTIPRDVDAVVLDGLTSDHEQQLRLLPPGIPVFVEKPLGIDLGQAATICELLALRLHGTGLFLHHVPAIQTWLQHSRQATGLDLAFGHTARSDGAFDGEYAWMVDPQRGGSGTFADLGIHLTHLVQCAWPDAILASSTVDLVPDPIRGGDVSGQASLQFDAGRAVRLQTSSIAPWGVQLTATTPSGTWTVDGGRLYRNGSLAMEGTPPAAGTAVTAWIDQIVAAPPSRPSSALATELLAAQQLLASAVNGSTPPTAEHRP